VRIALRHEATDDTVIAANVVHLPLVAVHDVASVIALWSGISRLRSPKTKRADGDKGD
jgi:hypothetical protein